MNEGNLGERVRALRDRRGLSQGDLAERAGVTCRTVQRIEAGEVRPYNDTVRRLAHALVVEVEELTATGKPSAPGKRRLILFHLSPLSGFLIPLAQILAPVSLWLIYRAEDEALGEHLRDIVLFHAVTTLLLVASLILVAHAPIVGFALAAGVVLFCTGLTFWNAYRLSETGTYDYFVRLPG